MLPIAFLAYISLDELFNQFALILLISAGCGALAIVLRQPLIIAFIAVGIIVSPAGLDVVAQDETWDLLAQTGIAILLFVVGLKLDLDVIRKTGPVALATGLGQVAFTSAVGFLLCLALGMSVVHATYVSIALTFSSTIIIVKLLSDKREIDSLHGRIAVGFLIVQDIVVVIVMIALSAGGDNADRGFAETAGLTIVRGVVFLAALGLAMKFFLPPLLRVVARSQELLVLTAIAWAASLAVASVELGFSEEVGAFLAGVAIASTPYRDSISSRLVALRDFLLLFFFITLGGQLDFGEIAGQAGPAVVLSVFVLVGNPVIVMIIMGALGYRRRTSFLAGLTVAQISEFSLILAALGVSLGHLDSERLGLVTLVGLITIGISSYMILYSHRLYDWLAPYLKVFERAVPHAEDEMADFSHARASVILFGLGRFGSNIARELQARGVSLVAVDFDPQAVLHAQGGGYATHYGDAEDPEFHAHLPLTYATWMVSTVPDVTVNRTLLHSVREHGFRGRVALTAHNEVDAERLRQLGADLVLLPFEDAATEAADKLHASLGEANDPASGAHSG